MGEVSVRRRVVGGVVAVVLLVGLFTTGVGEAVVSSLTEQTRVAYRPVEIRVFEGTVWSGSDSWGNELVFVLEPDGSVGWVEFNGVVAADAVFADSWRVVDGGLVLELLGVPMAGGVSVVESVVAVALSDGLGSELVLSDGSVGYRLDLVLVAQ